MLHCPACSARSPPHVASTDDIKSELRALRDLLAAQARPAPPASASLPARKRTHAEKPPARLPKWPTEMPHIRVDALKALLGR